MWPSLGSNLRPLDLQSEVLQIPLENVANLRAADKVDIKKIKDNLLQVFIKHDVNILVR